MFFLTTCGISVEQGVTCQRMDEILMQEKMMEASNRTVVIVDSSKLGTNSLVKMCDVDQEGLADSMANGIYIAWATGGNMAPEQMVESYLNTYFDTSRDPQPFC